MPRGRPRKNPIPESQEQKIEALKTVENPNQMEIEQTKDGIVMGTQSCDAILSMNGATLDKNSVTFREVEKIAETIVIDEQIQLKLKSNIPPIKRERNEYGFLNNVDYVFKEDGKVNWRKMIPAEFLVFNRDKKAEIENVYGKKLESLSVTEVDDKYLLILLFGIRYLASLRGYASVLPTVTYCSDYKATVATSIYWIGNNDTEMRQEYFGDVASATFENTNGFGRKFLESIAANRAFVRAVRNYLEINIVGFDEVAADGKSESDNTNIPSTNSGSLSVNSLLESKAKELGLTFDQFKEGVKNKYKDSVKSDFTKWLNYLDLPPTDAYIMLDIISVSLQAKKVGK